MRAFNLSDHLFDRPSSIGDDVLWGSELREPRSNADAVEFFGRLPVRDEVAHHVDRQVDDHVAAIDPASDVGSSHGRIGLTELAELGHDPVQGFSYRRGHTGVAQGARQHGVKVILTFQQKGVGNAEQRDHRHAREVTAVAFPPVAGRNPEEVLRRPDSANRAMAGLTAKRQRREGVTVVFAWSSPNRGCVSSAYGAKAARHLGGTIEGCSGRLHVVGDARAPPERLSSSSPPGNERRH